MKTELIEYHRKKAALRRQLQSEHSPEGHSHIAQYHGQKADFHERAVAWLESIGTINPDTGLYIAPMPKGGMMVPVVHERITSQDAFKYPVLSVLSKEQAESMSLSFEAELAERKRLEALTRGANPV
jgi:hypothetical protein